MTPRSSKPYDIYPAQVFRDDCRMNVENRPTFNVDPSDVPNERRDRMSPRGRWEISRDFTYPDDFEPLPPEDVKRFWFDVNPRQERICQWLNPIRTHSGKGVAVSAVADFGGEHYVLRESHLGHRHACPILLLHYDCLHHVSKSHANQTVINGAELTATST